MAIAICRPARSVLDMPQLLGQAVSHGCIRVSNLTATKLRQFAPLGTPIVITDT